MEENSENLGIEKISKSGLKKFIRHLYLVSNKYKDRQDARDILRKQVTKLKASTLGRKTKQKIMDEFNELENKISLVLEKEADILNMRTGEQDYKEILREVEENRRETEEIKNSLFGLKEEIETLARTRFNREQRITQLEKKIKERQKNKTYLPGISEKLNLLEQKYNQLKKKNKYSKTELEKIKFKIESIKLRAAVANS